MKSVDRDLTPCRESGEDIKLLRVRIALMSESDYRSNGNAQEVEAARILDDRQ
jgi:hypothetical protein